MSYNDFRQKISVDIKVEISGEGQFNPFENGGSYPIDWTLTGTMQKKDVTINTPFKQQICGPYFAGLSHPDYYAQFGYNGVAFTPGNGGTSQFLIPGDLRTLTQYRFIEEILKGTWSVNTKPVLSSGGNADGEAVLNTAYIVGKPANQEINDPITFDPAIDGLKRVYPGDVVLTSGNSSYWQVNPQQRLPDPKTTFFWTPNTSPNVESGGKVDGDLAVPGTVMIPTKTFYIEKFEDAIDGMQYFIEGCGIKFNGQRWLSYCSAFVFEKQDKTKEFLEDPIALGELSMPYVQDLETVQSQKPYVSAYIPIDYDAPFKFSGTPSGSTEPILYDMYFKWLSPMDSMDDNIMPAVGFVYDFSDPWSKKILADRKWISDRIPGAYGDSFLLSTKDNQPEDYSLRLSVNNFVDGNVTTIESEMESDGQTLYNSFTITTTISISQA